MSNAESSSSSAPAKPKITDDAVYKKGDMTIISSDAEPVRFRLPSFYLLAASTVIRDMYRPGSAEPFEVVMTDSAIETANSIRLWLDMMTHDWQARTRSIRDRSEMGHVASSQSLDTEQNYISEIIYFAANFDVPDLMAKAIRIKWDIENESGDADQIKGLQEIPDGLSFHPAAWPLVEWRQIPSDFTWALSRVHTLKVKPTERAETFLSLMKQIKELDSSKKRKRDE